MHFHYLALINTFPVPPRRIQNSEQTTVWHRACSAGLSCPCWLLDSTSFAQPEALAHRIECPRPLRLVHLRQRIYEEVKRVEG